MTKEKTCNICKGIIVVPGEPYCKLIQFNEDDDLISEAFYHILCFRQKSAMNNKVSEMMGKTMNLLNKVEGRIA